MIRKYFGKLPETVKAPEAYEFEKLEFAEYRTIIAKADVIFYFDRQTKEARLVFSRSLLQGIGGRARKRDLVTIAFALKFESEQLEKLAEWTLTVKGSYDWAV